MRETTADPTYADDTVVDDRTPPPAASAPSPSGRSGRVTVLPRLDASGEAPRLVQEERPRFQELSELGVGGLGVVVSANDQDIGRRVAIKRIRPDRLSQGAFLRFVQEVRTVGRLDHPNIVPIHDVGRDADGSYYFVMKYVDGETLEDILERLRAGDRATHARWTFERRAELFLQVLHAVQFAHDRAVVHRDLKPANVMVGRHGEVQLLDWGVARLLDQAEVIADGESEAEGARSGAVTTTRIGQLIGTPRYMSPEQARGEPVDERADTWALSVLFYEWLTLQYPFPELDSVEEVLDAVQNAPIPSATVAAGISKLQPPVPADLMWYAVDGMQRDGTRYATVAQMVQRLERRNDGEIPIQCPVTFQKSMIARGTRWIDRHPVASVVALVAGTAGLVLAAAGGIVLAVVVLGRTALLF